MTTKPTKKKAASKTSAKASSAKVSKASASLSAKPKMSNSSTIIPFNPVGAFGVMTDALKTPDMSNFNQTLPALAGAFEPMETAMNAFKTQYDKMFAGDASAAMRESVESMTKSSETFTKSAEQMMKMMSQMMQESADRNAEAMKALMACRTMNEYAEASNKLAQQNFDEAMSAMTKFSEMSIKMCSQAMEPMNSQMTKAMSGMMAPASSKKNAA